LKAGKWFRLGRLLIVPSSFAGTTVPAVRQPIHSSYRPKLWSRLSASHRAAMHCDITLGTGKVGSRLHS